MPPTRLSAPWLNTVKPAAVRSVRSVVSRTGVVLFVMAVFRSRVLMLPSVKN